MIGKPEKIDEICNGQRIGNGILPEPLSRAEAANLLWEEYALRQTHYWASFNRYALAVCTISIIPYVKTDVIKPLGNMVLIFPVIGFLLSVACCWLLGAEYQRLRMIRQKYDELLGDEYRPTRMPLHSFWDRIVAHRIGTVTSLTFGIGFSLLEIINAVLLMRLT